MPGNRPGTVEKPCIVYTEDYNEGMTTERATFQRKYQGLTHTEVVHASGLVEWSIVGTWKDSVTGRREPVNERGTRQYPPFELSDVIEARTTGGWCLVPEV